MTTIRGRERERGEREIDSRRVIRPTLRRTMCVIAIGEERNERWDGGEGEEGLTTRRVEALYFVNGGQDRERCTSRKVHVHTHSITEHAHSLWESVIDLFFVCGCR